MAEKLTLREIQQQEFEILKVFAAFCDRHGLRYYLSGGTLLGAVREGGFIPWDDDIDVIMPRPDYIRFLSLFDEAIGKKELEQDFYRLSVNEFDPIARVMDTRTMTRMRGFNLTEKIGIWIDIFPMDGVPENKLAQRIHFTWIRFLRDCQFLLTTTRNIRRRNRLVTLLQYFAIPFMPLLRAIGTKRIATHINRLASRYAFEGSKYCAAVSSGYGLPEINIRVEFERPTTIMFEGSPFTTTAAYHTYLTQLYGEYMQPPPEDKRDKHKLEAWWRTEEDGA